MRGRSLLVAVTAVSTAIACTPGARPPRLDGGVLRVAVSAFESLAPSNTNDPEGEFVSSALFAGLVDYAPDTAEPRNVMAESIESHDGRAWTIRVKRGWTFHDGTPVTAASYADTWNFTRAAASKQRNKKLLDRVRAVSAPDDVTLEVILDAPYRGFPALLGHPAYFPMPASAFADLAAFERKPVGNGPYRAAGTWDYRSSNPLRATRFAGYRGTPGHAREISFRVYGDLERALSDAAAGTVDLVSQVPRELVAQARRDFPTRTMERAGDRVTLLGSPFGDARFRDPRVRRALSLAIDRESLARVANGDPARSMAAPVLRRSHSETCRYCEHDPERARSLLREAGGWRGELTLSVFNHRDEQAWAEALAAQWRATLGISSVTVRVMDTAQGEPPWGPYNLPGPASTRWRFDFPGVENLVEAALAADPPEGAGYRTSAVSRLLAEASRASASGDAVTTCLAAESLLLDDLPVTPLFFDRVVGVRTARVTHVPFDVRGRVDLAGVRVDG